MNRKKFLSFTVVLASLIFLLVACGNQEADRNNAGSAPEATEPVQTEGRSEAYTKYTDYEPVQAVPAELIPGTNRNILVAYFSRSGNTWIGDGVDAVSSASLTVNEDGSTLGNTEQIAR